jgi:hypothetical protein
VIRVCGGSKNVADLQAQLLDPHERKLRQRSPHAVVWDMRDANTPSRETRQYMQAWLAVQEPLIAEYTVASAVVARSQAMRLMMSALFVLQPPPAKNYRVFAQIGAALRWSARSLDQAGIAYDKARLEALLQRESGSGPTAMLA